MPIDPRSDRPVYKQLADELRIRIRSGEYRPGDPLPSENRLVQEHQIGREAVRQGIGVLRMEGLVSTARGRGSVVRQEVPREPIRLRSGDRAVTRMPVEPERYEYDLEEGVPLIVVTRHDGTVETYAGDRYEIAEP